LSFTWNNATIVVLTRDTQMALYDFTNSYKYVYSKPLDRVEIFLV